MKPPARWTTMDSPVEPANDAEAGGADAVADPHLSASGLTGGSMGPPARWTTMDSPVEPANDKRQASERQKEMCAEVVSLDAA